MIHRKLTLVLSLCSMLTVDAQVLGTEWLWSAGSTSVDRGSAVAVDDDGNVFVTGAFTGTVDFDPGPAVFNLTSAGNVDIYVAKFGADGSFVWAARIGGPHYDSPIAIAVDPQGNVYSTGGFSGTADFDAGPGTFTMTAATTGQTDIYVLKLDPDGELVWAKGIIGGTWWDQGYGIEIDPSGNVVVAGRFYYQGGPRDFDPGPGVHLLTAGHEDIFVLKLTSNGDLIHAVNFGTGPHESRAYSVVVDESGNIYATGYFRGAVDFDPGPDTFTMTSVGTWNIFYLKLDPDLNLVWAKQLPITTTTYHSEPRGYGRKLALDGQGHLLATGRFSGTIDLDPGTTVAEHTATGDHDAYVLKFTLDGQLVWARAFGGNGYDEGFGIACDAQGHVHVAGVFNGAADLDPGPDEALVTGFGNDDIFVVHLDANGSFIRAGAMGGSGSDIPTGLCLDADGAPIITGLFSATADLDPGPGTLNVVSAGNTDAFLLKVAEFDPAGIAERGIGTLRFHPNPATHRIVIEPADHAPGTPYMVEILDARGRVIHMERMPAPGGPITIELPAEWSAGLHLLRFQQGNAPPSTGRLVLTR